jgi:hypothetical protein
MRVIIINKVHEMSEIEIGPLPWMARKATVASNASGSMRKNRRMRKEGTRGVRESFGDQKPGNREEEGHTRQPRALVELPAFGAKRQHMAGEHEEDAVRTPAIEYL